MTRRCYGFARTKMRETCAHGGRGAIRTARVEQVAEQGAANFIDLTVVPPGTSIGVHTHGPTDEEIYIVISGRGRMSLEDEEFDVGPGDVIVNNLGILHAAPGNQSDRRRRAIANLACSGDRRGERGDERESNVPST